MFARSRTASAILVVIALAAALLSGVTAPAQAVAEDSGGVFVPVTPFRLVDTSASNSNPINPNQTRSYTVLGQGDIPATGVSAVVIDIGVKSTDTSAGSYIKAWPSGEPMSASAAIFYSSASVPRSNTAIVKVGSTGAISFYNYLGNTGMDVDVQGYFTTASDQNSVGGFVPIDPIRVASSTTGEGIPQGMIPAGGVRDIQVTDVDAIPADATAVFANVEIQHATANGSARLSPGGVVASASQPATINYSNSGPLASGSTIRLSSDGKIRLSNSTSGSSIDIKVDVQGYFTGDPTKGGSFTPLTPAPVYTSTSGSSTPLAAGETRTIPVAGTAGIPDDGTAGSAVLVITAVNWSSTGTITVYNADKAAPPEATNLTLKNAYGGLRSSSLAVVELSVDGYIKIRNTTTATVDFYLTAQGWFSPPTTVSDGIEAEVGLIPTEPTELVNTQKGVGLPQARIVGGSPVTAQITGRSDIPAGATAVFGNVRVTGANTTGSLRLGASNADLSNAPNSINYGANSESNVGMTVKLGTDGKIQILSPTSSSSLDLIFDVQGYFSGNPDDGTSYTPIEARHIYASTDSGSTPLAPGETRTFPVAGLAGIPGDAGSAVLTVSAKNWTQNGSLSISNPALESSATTNLNFKAGLGTPAVGSSTTALVELSDEGKVNVTNTSSAPVDFNVTGQGWVTQYEEPYVNDGSETEMGPNPELQILETAPATPNIDFTFIPPVEGTFTLGDVAGGKVKLVRDGVIAGTYSATAVDDVGNTVPTTVHASGSQLIQTVSPTATAEYPVVVVPTFVASDPTLPEVQEIYPPAEAISDEPSELAASEPVTIVDEGTESFVADLTDLAGEEGDTTVDSTDKDASQFSVASASKPYVPVPKTTKNGKVVRQKYYYYDPKGKHPKRLPWKKTWHDYCSSNSPDSYGSASFKGPCARHDLCIEFKQAPDRSYCDDFLKKNMRTNCRYAYSAWYYYDKLHICYGYASSYHKAVSNSTANNHDPGHWGNINNSYYPYYRWDTW